jgi:hypothetical protein
MGWEIEWVGVKLGIGSLEKVIWGKGKGERVGGSDEVRGRTLLQ